VSARNSMITQEHFKLLAAYTVGLTPDFTRQLLTYQNCHTAFTLVSISVASTER